MRARDVADVLRNVAPPPVGAGHAAVRELAAGLGAYVGWDEPGTAVLLLPPQRAACPEIRLRHLDLLPAARVALRMSEEEPHIKVHQAAVLRCRLEHAGLELAFESVVAALCSRLEEEGELDLSVQIPSLERLFAAFRESAVYHHRGALG